MTPTCLSLGGCPLNNPLGSLVREKRLNRLYRTMGFQHTPFALSSNGALQLMRYLRGELKIPEWVRDSCYADPRPEYDPSWDVLLADVDVVLMEMSTPIEYVYEGYILNQNRFREQLAPVREISREVFKAVGRWMKHGVESCDETLRLEHSRNLLSLIPQETEAEKQIAMLIRDTHGHITSEDDIYKDLEELKPLLPGPLGIVLHNFSYMPDGRPIIWPADFKDNTIAAAARAGVPCYDPLPLVQRHWEDGVLMEDMRHYTRAFYDVIAEDYLAFMRLLQPSLLLGARASLAA